MAIIPLIQGSKEWLDYRRSHIMATDAAIIMQINPWKSMLNLWEEKLLLCPQIEENDAMRRGTKLEPEARELASELLSTEFVPCVYQCNKRPWQAASLDGVSKMFRQVLEIKCPKEETHIKAINGIMPEYYRTQIQHQLAVTKADIAYYFSYRPEYKEKYAIIEVYPDYDLIGEMNLKEYEFYMNMSTLNPPVWKFKERKLS